MNGTVFYHKEPIQSSRLVKKSIWQNLRKENLNLMFVHARAASAGKPIINKNNHPFTSTDKEICLIHNGCVPEYDELKKKFEVVSECDSEILLRIIEAGGGSMDGIRDIFSFTSQAQMAVALGERHNDGKRTMWLFRNKHRSLWLIDLRRPLGQVFFCSTPEIWTTALSEKGITLNSIQKLIELPVQQVWQFTLDGEHPATVKRYEVCREQGILPVNDDFVPIQQRKVVISVVSKLNSQEELENNLAVKNKRRRLNYDNVCTKT